jgi:hypothetical protein
MPSRIGSGIPGEASVGRLLRSAAGGCAMFPP